MNNLGSVHEQSQYELVRLEQLCQQGALKNKELVDQNNKLLLKVF